jgi:hypothetical protein
MGFCPAWDTSALPIQVSLGDRMSMSTKLTFLPLLMATTSYVCGKTEPVLNRGSFESWWVRTTLRRSLDAYVLNFPDKLYAGQNRSEPVDEIRHEEINSPFSMD